MFLCAGAGESREVGAANADILPGTSGAKPDIPDVNNVRSRSELEKLINSSAFPFFIKREQLEKELDVGVEEDMEVEEQEQAGEVVLVDFLANNKVSEGVVDSSSSSSESEPEDKQEE